MCDACATYALAGFSVCNICEQPVASGQKDGKPERKLSTQAKAVNSPKNVHPAPLKVMPTKQYTKSIAPILATLKADGMDTDSKIADGLRTGRVVQAISWQVNYLHVIDYLESNGFDVGRYRYRVVCGSLAA